MDSVNVAGKLYINTQYYILIAQCNSVPTLKVEFSENCVTHYRQTLTTYQCGIVFIYRCVFLEYITNTIKCE